MMSLWHDWFGHPGTEMMQKFIKNSIGHSIKNVKIPLPNELWCSTRHRENW